MIEVIGPPPKATPFFSFSYSYAEILARDGKARVKAKKMRLEDGKLTSETHNHRWTPIRREMRIGTPGR